MNISKNQIRELAHASRVVCARGNEIVIWPDGSWTEAAGPTDQKGLILQDGRRIYPILRLRWPATQKTIRQFLIERDGWK